MRTNILKQGVLIVFAAAGVAFALDLGSMTPAKISNSDLVKFTIEQRYDNTAHQTNAIAVHFQVDEDWHFYADPCDAPGGAALKVIAIEEPNAFEVIKKNPDKHYMSFNQWDWLRPILPAGEIYNDEITGTTTKIITGKFTVYLLFKQKLVSSMTGSTPIQLIIKGALCSKEQCRMVKFTSDTIITSIPNTLPQKPRFELPDVNAPAKSDNVIKDGKMQSYSTFAALGLAFLAGVILNIMPCVLPVIPLKVLSIFEQAKESKFRCVTLGLAFCGGILAFFAALATVNIIMRLSLGIVFQWGDHFRNPMFVVGMAILMVILAMIMFGAATVTVPAVSSSGKRKGGYAGSVGMGFLAALLSTPCSFAILTAAFAWAQSQSLFLGTIAIMTIGIGMAAPYAILTSMPGLLQYLPRPGRWMEIFKQAMGFVLLVVAIWLISVLPLTAYASVSYFAAIVAFCVWMWGSWVSYDSSALKKWIVRILALLIAGATAYYILPPAMRMRSEFSSSWQGTTVWHKYDKAVIAAAIAEKRPVLIEWTADWCLTCKAVEKTVYDSADIQQLIKEKNVLTIKADTTWASNSAAVDLQKIYNEPGVPVQMLFVPGKSEPVRLHGLIIGKELKRLLEGL